MKDNYLRTVRHPAVYAVWAAVIAAGNLLPTFPIWGVGGNFSIANILNPLSGIFFGPLGGALCSAVGGFIGSVIAPHTAWMGLGTFVIGMVTAFTTGCIAWGKWPLVSMNKSGSFVFNGGIIVYAAGTILWFTQEIGRSAVSIPVVFYSLGFAAMVTGIIFARKMLIGDNQILKFPAIWLCSFAGLIGGATIGNFFSLVLFKQPKEVWAVLTVTAPVERVIFAMAAMFVGAPLLIGLNKIGIFAGPQDENKELEIRNKKERKSEEGEDKKE